MSFTLEENSIVISCQAASFDLCLKELAEMEDIDIKLDKWLVRGVGIVKSDKAFDLTADIIKKLSPIFLRHIFPLEYYIKDFTKENTEFIDMYNNIKNRLDKSKTFTVQARVLSEPYVMNKHELAHMFSDLLIKDGYEFNVDEPNQVISLVYQDRKLFGGLSMAEQNISDWAGGMRRYAKTEEQISRAEMKLLEALEIFDINLELRNGLGLGGGLGLGEALDLGAAPGGWTNILVQKGYKVTSVDPAKLDKNLINRFDKSLITHEKSLAEDYIKKANKTFDIIVNDMRMDTVPSANIMIDCYDLLKENGLFIMTFKLPKTNKMKMINKGLKILSEKYKVLGAKQLFHNRSEITVYGKKE